MAMSASMDLFLYDFVTVAAFDLDTDCLFFHAGKWISERCHGAGAEEEGDTECWADWGSSGGCFHFLFYSGSCTISHTTVTSNITNVTGRKKSAKWNPQVHIKGLPQLFSLDWQFFIPDLCVTIMCGTSFLSSVCLKLLEIVSLKHMNKPWISCFLYLGNKQAEQTSSSKHLSAPTSWATSLTSAVASPALQCYPV